LLVVWHTGSIFFHAKGDWRGSNFLHPVDYLPWIASSVKGLKSVLCGHQAVSYASFPISYIGAKISHLWWIKGEGEFFPHTRVQNVFSFDIFAVFNFWSLL
jgi:hypothetical protein